MELPDLGKQCSNQDCKQIDFIPLKCLCGSFFCKEHFMGHCLSNVCKYYPINAANFTENSQVYRCSFENCITSSYINMPCNKCNKHFCIEHRFHPECPEIDPEILEAEKARWAQPREQFNKAKELVENEITKKLRISQQSSSKAKTALKVQLMKLKSKAKGEQIIPTVDRVYFAVIKPKNNEPKRLINAPHEENTKNIDKIVDFNNAVFVSKDWSLGRVIDSISNTCGVKNENDKSNASKLRIFRDSDNMCVNTSKMDIKLSELLEREVLINGERIILEYITAADAASLNVDEVFFIVDI